MMPLEIALAVAAICLVTEAFFSGSEIAMVSADRVRLRRQAQAGDEGSRLALRFLEAPQRLLATTLLGTNISIVTATTVMTLAFIGEPGGEAMAVALMTPVFLIFAEVVPKTIFQQNADFLAPRIVYPLRLASWLFAPALWALGFVIAAVARLFHVEERRALVTREEIVHLLDAEDGNDGGTGLESISEGERDLIRSVLDFGERTVYDVMVPLSEVTALPEDASIDEAAAEIVDKQHTRVPVYRERVDQIVGVLQAHDVLAAEAAGRKGTVADLAKPAIFVPEAKPTADLLADLQRQKVHLVVVVDEYGGATGICTAEDILEEIVGEIDDEYDKAPPTVRAEGPGLWRVLGRTKITDLNTELCLDLPEGEDYESVAGLLLERLKRIPREGESVRLGDVTITVLSTSERAIEELRIRVVKKR
jgi:CBS domain containing-hemolysin-like protein